MVFTNHSPLPPTLFRVQDEKGAAARFSVELDDSLGGSPKQYREVQGHESDLFLSYFRHNGGVEYLPGGTASGFNHVVPDTHVTRLLHVKGRRNIRVSQVELGVASLNHGDVFILDGEASVFTVRRHALFLVFPVVLAAVGHTDHCARVSVCVVSSVVWP